MKTPSLLFIQLFGVLLPKLKLLKLMVNIDEVI